MSDGVTSSVKEYTSSIPSSNIFTLGTHNIQTGEKVIILSDDGDLPENIVENTVYYAIRHSSTQIKLASSESAAVSGNEIAVYKGTNLRILSRVSDKFAGDVGHPVQWDGTQWYITTNAGSGAYNAIITLGVAGLTERTEPSYVKRVEDTRSLDEKLYKIRVVIPKELVGAKNPENGFIIQESSSTGYRNNTDFSLSSLTKSDYEYNRNPRFISTCSRVSSTVTVISELPHNLQVGDSIIVKNVTDSTNPTGKDNLGYNGTVGITSVVDDMTFRYTTTRTPGSFTNVTSNRTTLLPRFERNNLQSNLYNYRSELITPYISGIQDGVYHIYTLSADKAVPTEFTNIKYSQNVVDLYPQLDRDNINDNPTSSKSFAKRDPLGEVVTNDLKKSITKESTDTLLTTLGVGLDVSSVSNSTSSATITFARKHGLAGIVTGTITPGASYINGTYQNLKLLNTSQTGTWRGATARVSISGGAVVSVDVVSSGSGYSAGPLFFDASVIGNGNGAARYTIATSGITTAIGNVVQFTGAGTTSDTYHRITAVSADNQISIAKTAGDPVITQNQYAFIVGPSVQITTTTYSSGVRTFNCSGPHGLVAGNKFRVIDSSNNNRGDYLVRDRVSANIFTALTPNISVNNGHILKHGLSVNNSSSDSAAENLGVRSIPLFDKETLVTVSGITTTALTIPVSSPVGAAAITKRFPLGSYIQIDEEIMRVASSTLSGGGGNEITVIRGALATRQVSHDSGSLIRKIKPISIEFRRPSIVRASGHTFEYLGYGPGNYSTGLPQVQTITLTEREEFLVQSQERSGGIVVYTGMNNNGDSFIGNRKTSSSTGEEVTFDNPIPTVTGEDPSRLSVVFDEVTVKERLVVEGGNSGTILSQFDGPVTFNKEVKFTDAVNVRSQLKVSSDTQSTTTANGALVVSGGVGIAKNLNVGGSVAVSGITTLTGLLDANGGATIDNIRIGVANDNEIDTSTGDLIIDSAGGTVNITDRLNVSGIATFQSDVFLGDGDDLYFGDGNDLRIFHNGSNSFIDVTSGATGDLYIRNTRISGSVHIQADNVSGTLRNVFVATGADSAAQLFFDGTKRFETTRSGAVVSGIITATTGFVPDADEGAYLGTALLPFSEAHIGEIRIANSTLNNTIDTATGNLTLDSVGGTVVVNDNLEVRENLYVGRNGGGNSIIYFYNDSANNYNPNIQFNDIAATIDSNSVAANTFYFNRRAFINGQLQVTGDITAFFTSDQRLKDNITPIPDALSKVLSISGNTFDWNEKSEKEGSDVGVIAQEILEVLPEAVTTRDNGYLAVRYEKLVPLLIEAIKELKEEINELKGVK
jgi:hypothetical protein